MLVTLDNNGKVNTNTYQAYYCLSTRFERLKNWLLTLYFWETDISSCPIHLSARIYCQSRRKKNSKLHWQTIQQAASISGWPCTVYYGEISDNQAKIRADSTASYQKLMYTFTPRKFFFQLIYVVLTTWKEPMSTGHEGCS